MAMRRKNTRTLLTALALLAAITVSALSYAQAARLLIRDSVLQVFAGPLQFPAPELYSVRTDFNATDKDLEKRDRFETVVLDLPDKLFVSGKPAASFEVCYNSKCVPLSVAEVNVRYSGNSRGKTAVRIDVPRSLLKSLAAKGIAARQPYCVYPFSVRGKVYAWHQAVKCDQCTIPVISKSR
jgi:hypothetical protein